MDLKFYLAVENDKIIMASQSVSGGDIIDVEVTEEVYNGWLADNELYIYKDGKIIKNPDYEAIKEAEEKQARISELKEQLDSLDTQAVRPLRAIVSGTDTEYDHTKLENIEAQAEAIRQEIHSLEQ